MKSKHLLDQLYFTHVARLIKLEQVTEPFVKTPTLARK